MRTIDSDLRSKSFKHIYLLYGSESYLIRYYRNALIKALLPEDDGMNLTRFTDKDFDEPSVIEACDTMPFFAECRVILCDNSGCFDRKSEQLSAYLDNIPETAYLIFAETKVDKRKSMYKKVKKYGDVEELGMPDEETLKKWMLKRVKAAGLNIMKSAWSSFYARTSDSMDNMSNEMDKLIAYCNDCEVITEEDVNAICMNWLDDKVYAMIEAIADKDPARAAGLYRDMLLLHERPIAILARLRSQFARLLTLKEMSFRREPDSAITKATRIPGYYLERNRSLAGNFTTDQLCALLSDADDLDGAIKTGRINEHTGLEMLMAKYAA